ncbi:PREDICTED: WAT1-related protein At4g15540-like isoform X2 [Erythranthe guttata]|uniref:WAT1-related protein At4g15540-like isoform X2 n=1 Tax=Erythranthe guttata TaxID=4155 RepID=UPI00064DC948|nr:PREDICTED: WAT1-related protein At4g15540-like isoform X2 [Erythranthe guttata]|eukprot:XP_012846558.1 PREDICTED: WAT1-related protein At4g15540-like isoform X2 [Erythranthe guttata]
MEKFNYTSATSIAKSIGTLVSVIGALIVTLYQGPSILGISSHSDETLTSSSAWLIGGLLLTIDSLVASIFIIAQAIVLKKCPAELVLMLFYSCFVAILSAAASFIVEKDLNAWSLKHRMRFIPVIYSVRDDFIYFHDLKILYVLKITSPFFFMRVFLFLDKNAGAFRECIPSIDYNVVCEKKGASVCIGIPSFRSHFCHYDGHRHFGRGLLSRKLARVDSGRDRVLFRNVGKS